MVVLSNMFIRSCIVADIIINIITSSIISIIILSLRVMQHSTALWHGMVWYRCL